MQDTSLELNSLLLVDFSKAGEPIGDKHNPVTFRANELSKKSNPRSIRLPHKVVTTIAPMPRDMTRHDIRRSLSDHTPRPCSRSASPTLPYVPYLSSRVTTMRRCLEKRDGALQVRPVNTHVQSNSVDYGMLASSARLSLLRGRRLW